MRCKVESFESCNRIDARLGLKESIVGSARENVYDNCDTP